MIYSTTAMSKERSFKLSWIDHLKAIPTWPWRPETAQFVLAAIALSLVLKILRFLVEQAFTW